MAAPKPSTRFTLKGPIFNKPSQVSIGFQQAVNRGLFDLATIEGSNKVLDQLWGPPVSQYNTASRQSKHGRKTGELRRHIGAAVVSDGVAVIAAGEQQGRMNLIYSAWVEGISSRNQTTSFKGYHMFENAYDHINNNPKLYEDYIASAIVEAFD